LPDPGLAGNVRRDLYLTLRLLTFPAKHGCSCRHDHSKRRWESSYANSLANTRALYETCVPLVFAPTRRSASATSTTRSRKKCGRATRSRLPTSKSCAQPSGPHLGLGDAAGTISLVVTTDLASVHSDPTNRSRNCRRGGDGRERRKDRPPPIQRNRTRK
jgi:hypothetical protein